MMIIKHEKEKQLLSHYNSNVTYFSPIDIDMFNKIIAWFDLKIYTQSNVLDIGCGTGVIANHIHEKYGAMVSGIDYSEERIKVARNNSSGSAFYFGDVNIIIEDFKDNTFDLITVFETLEHLVDPVNILSHCKRILKPDGLLIGSIPIDHKYIAHIQYYESLEDVEKQLGVKARLLLRTDHRDYIIFSFR